MDPWTDQWIRRRYRMDRASAVPRGHGCTFLNNYLPSCHVFSNVKLTTITDPSFLVLKTERFARSCALSSCVFLNISMTGHFHGTAQIVIGISLRLARTTLQVSTTFSSSPLLDLHICHPHRIDGDIPLFHSTCQLHCWIL